MSGYLTPHYIYIYIYIYISDLVLSTPADSINLFSTEVSIRAEMKPSNVSKVRSLLFLRKIKIASKLRTWCNTHAHFNTFLFYKMTLGLDCSNSQSDVSSIRKISDVWKYFTKTPDKKKVICSICHKERTNDK